MSLTVMDVEAKIPVYELDGKETEVNSEKLVVRSHWNRKDLVVICVEGREYTVAAGALDKAVSRCSHF